MLSRKKERERERATAIYMKSGPMTMMVKLHAEIAYPDLLQLSFGEATLFFCAGFCHEIYYPFGSFTVILLSSTK